HITNSQFHEIASSKSIQEHIYHATAGKIMRLLKLTVNLFLPEGQKEFIEVWKNFKYLPYWGHLPNPISHHESFMISDYLCLAMVIPFILNQFLKAWYIKSTELTNIQQ
ncbi:12809_t:CDS:2, partial [Gigaspora margarita]